MKWHLSHLTRTLPALIANGEAGDLVHELAGRVWSDRVSYVLKRDNRIDHVVPEAKVPVVVRPVRPDDLTAILKERPRRRPSFDAGVATCYVATVDRQVAYMQFLIDNTQNWLIRTRFPGLHPELGADEMLLEWAYTFKAYRGLGIMGRAMALISDRAAERGARWLHTNVLIDNVPSLKGCKNAGYRPWRLRTDHWRGFAATVTYDDLPDGTGYPFEH